MRRLVGASTSAASTPTESPSRVIAASSWADGAARREGEGGKGDPFTWRVILSTSPYSLSGGKNEAVAA
jgi:hypothetical protein